MFAGIKASLKIIRPIQAIRRFIPSLKASVPTVFEPLPPKRNGQSVMTFLHKKLAEKYDPTGKRQLLVDQHNGLRAGDIIKVTYRDRTSVIGEILAIKRTPRNVGSNILIRNKINKIGVETRIPLFNPKIKSIDLLHKPDTYLPRRKHYFIRNTKYDVGNVEATLTAAKKKA